MARNTQRDEKEAGLRKERILQAGFRLFSREGIESVSIQAVAEAAEVGVATVYKYFGTKAALAANISAYIWGSFIGSCEQEVSREAREKMDAYTLIAYYADMMIRLYTDRPDILRFSGNFKTYINREGVPRNVVSVHLDPLEELRENFHTQYEAARENGSIRTDIPEETVYTMVGITMLSMAERYAQGIVWADNAQRDHRQELLCLKEMLLEWVSKGRSKA